MTSIRCPRCRCRRVAVVSGRDPLDPCPTVYRCAHCGYIWETIRTAAVAVGRS